jgi:hypothetical protein
VTVPIPAADLAALRGYLRALDVEQLLEMADNPVTPSAVMPYIGEAIAETCALSTAALELVVWGDPQAPHYSLNGTAASSPRHIKGYRLALTHRQRHARGWPVWRPHDPTAEPVALLGGGPDTTVYYAGREVTLGKLRELYRDTEKLLKLLRSAVD